MRKIIKSGYISRVVRSNIRNKVTDFSNSTKTIKANNITKVVNSKINTFMDTSRFRWHKTPTPATNGVQVLFTIPNSEQYVSGLLEVMLDGIMQTKDVDYTETTSSTFTMVTAPDADEVLRVNYIKQ